MQGKIRKAPVQKAKNTEILYKDCVNSPCIIRQHVVVEIFYLTVLKQCVDSHVYFYAAKMRIVNCMKKIVLARIGGICSGSEPAAAYIDCVRPCCNHSFKTCDRACRG